jgi:hypothetical protein
MHNDNTNESTKLYSNMCFGAQLNLLSTYDNKCQTYFYHVVQSSHLRHPSRHLPEFSFELEQ